MRTAVLAGCAMGLSLGVPALGAAQTCGTTTTYTETFSSSANEDPSSSVAGWGSGSIELISQPSFSGNGFQDSAGLQLDIEDATPHDLVGWDHDGDGDDDPVFLMNEPECQINYGVTQGVDGSGVFQGFDWGGPGVNSHEIGEPSSCDPDGKLLVGNFGGDSREDLMYMGIAAMEKEGKIEKCYIYEPSSFNEHDDCEDDFPEAGTGPGGGVGAHWRGGWVQPVLWNGDSYHDLVVGTGYDSTNKVLLYLSDGSWGFTYSKTLLSDAGLHTPIASNAAEFTNNSSCPQSRSKGFTVVMAADFDGDSDNDLIVGSVSEEDLKYWTNDGSDNFTRQTDIPMYGGANYPVVHDFDGDGDQDFIVAGDKGNITKDDEDGDENTSCGGSTANGSLYYFDNNGAGAFSRSELTDLGSDVDWLLTLDLDGDNADDVLSGNEQECDDDGPGGTLTCSPVYLNMTSATGTTSGAGSSGGGGTYNTQGTALSTVLDSLDNTTYAIPQITVTSYTTTVPTDTAVDLYVSNDGGTTWETVQPDELPPTSNPHDFQSYGADLLFKAELSTTNTSKSPEIDTLGVSYLAVTKRLYSRSKLATATFDDSGTDRELLLSASYAYPEYRAQVRAYDITNLTEGGAGTSGLERVDTQASVSLFWDSGVQMAAQSGSSRVLYASYPSTSDGDNVVNDRVDFTEAELNSPTSSPSLETLMSVSSAEKIDVMRFLRNGMLGDSWKLFDIGHSSPVVVAAPPGDATYLGNDYASFQSAQSTRAPRVYIGANDGFVHAFDGLTGDESWGFVPYNLLAKVQNQRQTSGSVEQYSHGFFVDGNVVVQDVYNSSTTQWRTVLIAGQALGQGRFDNNYYVALDVTDPTSPQPLWEFTDPEDSPTTLCTTATTVESSECGVGSGLKCCEHEVSGVGQGEFFCAAVGTACPSPDPVLGETWSSPLFARVTVAGASTWVVFFGSGYNNRGTVNVGRSLYAVDALTGALLGRWDLTELTYDATTNPATLDNTLPASPAAVDIDADGDVDRVYIGDLEGRLWKLDVSQNGTLDGGTGRISQTAWPACVLFDAGDQDGDGNRNWAPVITKPGVAFVNGNDLPNVYFGTGGDDRAPDSLLYRFYGVYDDDAAGTCRSTPKYESDLDIDDNEWIVGDGQTNETSPSALSPSNSEGETGDRYWSDPLVVDNSMLFFASLPGDIESTNPCDSTTGTSKVYGYALRRFSDVDGNLRLPGQSLFSDPWLASDSKVRQAALARGVIPGGWSRKPNDLTATAQARDIFIQELTGSSAGEQPPLKRTTSVGVGTASGVSVKLMRWREIPLK